VSKWSGLGLVVLACSAIAAEPERFDEKIVVVGNASLVDRQAGLGSSYVIEEETIELTRATHPNELLVRVPGAWVSRGSGQEHLTAIRSPVYTGAGACGEFLFLENGVPIRPAGFCNVNNLFEVNTEQARQIEVLRGPGSAQFGGNAVHGAINALSPNGSTPWRLSVEGGPDEYVQARVAGSGQAGEQLLRLDAMATHTDGYRDDTGHDEQKLLLTQLGPVGDWRVQTTLSATNLDQDTGGFVRGYKAYKDSYLRKTNPNPEAYRDAWSVRLVSEWARPLAGGGELALTPYLRRSEMDFLMHFLPGQPREENGQKSAGLIAALADESDRVGWRMGSQLEWADGYLEQFQAGPDVGTRPQGLQYDYDVTSLMAAVFGDLRVDLTITPPMATRVMMGRRARTRAASTIARLTGKTISRRSPGAPG
jgi:outer membrane receptor protein involved in Fe transport